MKLFSLFIFLFYSCSDSSESQSSLYFEFVNDSLKKEIKLLKSEVLKKNLVISNLKIELDSIKNYLHKHSKIELDSLKKYIYKHSKIYFSKKSLINFSKLQVKDTLIISIEGDNWDDSKFKVFVKNNLNRSIYYFEQDYHNMVSGFDSEDYQFLAEVANRYTDGVFDTLETTNTLYDYLGDSENYEEYYETLKISLEDYNKLRNKAYPILRHNTYYEGWKKVYFDPIKKRTITIFNGGL